MSNDGFLGTPFNIASYALLTHILAKETGLEVGELVYTVGDLHIYENHIDAVKEQLSRKCYPLPTLVINAANQLFNPIDEESIAYTVDDFVLLNYQYHPPIKAEMAV